MFCSLRFFRVIKALLKPEHRNENWVMTGICETGSLNRNIHLPMGSMRTINGRNLGIYYAVETR